MQTAREIILSTVDGNEANERLLVVHCVNDQSSRVELRQQSWAEGIGWFTQSSLPLAPHQVGQLRNALGSHTAATTTRAPAVSVRRKKTNSPALKIARAESA